MKTSKLLLMLAVLFGIVLTSCVEDEVFEGPPSIANVTSTPQSPSEGVVVTVNAKVTDLNGVSSVKLYYKVGAAAFQSVNMVPAGNIYTATIPGQAVGAVVSYYIEANNVVGKSIKSPANAPTTTGGYTVGAALIVMNEIHARGVVGDPDWIEIYNDSNGPVNIGGYKVYDSGAVAPGVKPKMTIAAGTIIPAKGFFVIVVDDSATANPVGSNFGISSGGEQLWLENANGVIIDTTTNLDVTLATNSYGRKPDGIGSWVKLSQLTRGASNNNAPTLP